MALPVHIAFIMDGNGRWAQSRGVMRSVGHKAGAQTVRNLLRLLLRYGIPYVTLYAFSSENWARPQGEVRNLMWLFEFYLKHYLHELIEGQIRFLVIGDITPLPESLKQALQAAIERTRAFSKITLTLALNYGSRAEIVWAVQQYVAAVERNQEAPADLTWERLQSYLYTAHTPEPDLLIRTSGEKRLSNFLLLQSAYAELYFTDTPWPDFQEAHLAEALKAYALRHRRFGDSH